MQILCGQCRNRLKIDDDKAGKTLSCPECGHKIVVPQLGEVAEPVGPVEPAAPEISHLPEEEGFVGDVRQAMEKVQKIHITCGQCGRHLTVGMRLAGKKARCPSCKGRIRIPWPDEKEDFVFPSLAEEEAEVEAEAEVVEIVEGEDPLEELAAIAAIRRRGYGRRARLTWVSWVVMVLFGSAIVVAPLAWWHYFRQPKAEEQDWQTEAGHRGTQIAATRVVTQPVATIAVGTQPKFGQPFLKSVTAARDLFAVDGCFPARPGYVYWKVTVEVQAGSTPISFPGFGQQASVTVGDVELPSLGVVGGSSLLPVRAEERTIRLKAGESQSFVLVFEAPQSAAGGRLSLGNVGARDFTVPAPPPVPPEGALAGTYAEAPPRNLQPLLRDPVMAAIQGAADHALVVRSPARGLDVLIPDAGVQGRARPLGQGLYAAVLKRGDSVLDAKLRLIDGGKRLILYLSDEPFHQITYDRQ